MKWIRWDGDVSFDWRGTKPCSPTEPEYTDYISEEFIDCEKDANWREIESGVLDTETGKLCITLKPVKKVPTLREAVEAYRQKLIETFGVDEWQGNSGFKQAIFDALDREASTPANPYTKEAVDELLEATCKHDPRWFDESIWWSDSRKRLTKAVLVLKQQREAANGG